MTQISKFWFEKLASIVPNHFVTDKIDEMPEEVKQYKDQLDGRVMLVRKATVIPLEAIVRGYLTGASMMRGSDLVDDMHNLVILRISLG